MYKNIQSSQSQIQVFNLASGGATIDATLVPALKPEVLCCLFNPLLSSSKSHHRSIVDQVQQFKAFLSQKPDGAQWDGSNSLFAFWIGINDIVSRFCSLYC